MAPVTLFLSLAVLLIKNMGPMSGLPQKAKKFQAVKDASVIRFSDVAGQDEVSKSIHLPFFPSHHSLNLIKVNQSRPKEK